LKFTKKLGVLIKERKFKIYTKKVSIFKKIILNYLKIRRGDDLIEAMILKRNQIQRLGTYRGYRFRHGLPSHGQRTKKNAKTCKSFRDKKHKIKGKEIEFVSFAQRIRQRFKAKGNAVKVLTPYEVKRLHMRGRKKKSYDEKPRKKMTMVNTDAYKKWCLRKRNKIMTHIQRPFNQRDQHHHQRVCLDHASAATECKKKSIVA